MCKLNWIACIHWNCNCPCFKKHKGSSKEKRENFTIHLCVLSHEICSEHWCGNDNSVDSDDALLTDFGSLFRQAWTAQIPPSLTNRRLSRGDHAVVAVAGRDRRLAVFSNIGTRHYESERFQYHLKWWWSLWLVLISKRLRDCERRHFLYISRKLLAIFWRREALLETSTEFADNFR